MPNYKNAKKISRLQQHKKLIVYVLCIILVFSIVIFWQKLAYSPKFLQEIAGVSGVDEKPVSQDDIDSYIVAADKPRVLIIPKTNLKARILEVGLTVDNAVDTTKSIYDVGWYTGSSTPGQKGAAFLDGHVSGPNNKGIFYDLKKLKTGDEIIVQMGNGQKNIFIVKQTEEKRLEEVDMAKVLQPLDPNAPGLNLMTCSGKFNKTADTFVNRFIVYSVLK
ncbi:class F sortase [Candidatus Saccharibacteria bacterium]|nr:class F sortase [Candidatus Saccharibacteria bacterium]MDQ5885087.1 hypothetical protein [Patescibacteria group bacterium]MDQ5953383.1 hypothetical protein [Patescibacteria group bacterium]